MQRRLLCRSVYGERKPGDLPPGRVPPAKPSTGGFGQMNRRVVAIWCGFGFPLLLSRASSSFVRIRMIQPFGACRLEGDPWLPGSWSEAYIS